MTKQLKKFNFKAFLTLLTVFTLSFVLALSTACSSGNDSSSSSSSSSAEDTPKDEQTIKNGDFEFNTTEDTKFPYSSSIKWSRSYDGSSTGSYGGIIDVAGSAYEKLAEANIPKDGETSFNPGTPLTEDDADTEANEAGTKILMLRNDSADNGAAQYYTSSTSITLKKEEYARISVWVNTYGVTVPLGYEGGAYIKIKTGVDDEAPLLIKNINTGSTVGENGSKWVKYTVYVAPSATATTKLTMVLGFGSGSSAKENRVNGFAYFDNVEYKVIDKADYDAAVASADEKVSYYAADNTIQKDALTLDAANDGANKTVSLSLAKNLTSVDVSEGVGGDAVYNKINFATGATNKANNTAGYTLEQKTIGEESFENAVYMDFTSVKNSATYTSREFIVKKAKYTDGKKDDDNGNYAAFSFLAKVKTKSAATTNACVQIIESTTYGDKATGSFASFTTEGEYKRYTFYLTTNYEEDRTFRVRFNFGPTNEKGALPEVGALPQGYAIFTDFSFTTITKDEYTSADTTNSTKVALLGDHVADHVEDDDDESTDNYSFKLSKADAFDLATKPVDLKQTVDKTLSVLKSGEGSTVGIVNSKYSYATYAGLDDALATLKASIKGDNKNVQPLFIRNVDENGEVLIGGSTVTVKANTVYKFSVKVRVINGKAFVRLFEIAGVDGKDEVLTYDTRLAETEVNTETYKFSDGYAYIQYIIKAGDEDKNIRIETGVKGVGSALFDAVDAGSSASYSDTDSLINAEDFRDYVFGTVEERIGDEQNRVYYYAKKSEVGDESKRIKDDDGNYKFIVKDPVKVIAYGMPDASGASQATYESSTVKYFRFDTASMKYEIQTSSSKSDSSSDSSSSSSSESSSTSETVGNYAWLQIVSIIIAAVIIIALVAVIVRKALEGRKSKRAKTKAYYGGYNQKTAKTDGHRYSVKNAKNAAAKAESKNNKKSDVKVVDLDDSDKETAYNYGDGESETDDGNKGE